jgi:hypothetical protein
MEVKYRSSCWLIKHYIIFYTRKPLHYNGFFAAMRRLYVYPYYQQPVKKTPAGQALCCTFTFINFDWYYEELQQAAICTLVA